MALEDSIFLDKYIKQHREETMISFETRDSSKRRVVATKVEN